MIFAGDFNTFFNLKLEAKGGKQLLKKKSTAKLVEIKEVPDICDIWRIRNPNNRNFTFRENHSTGFKEHRLYYIYSFPIAFKNLLITQIYYLLYQLIILHY